MDFETWQLVAYKSPLFEDKLILRVIGYPGNLRIDHPTDLRVESGRKQWLLDDKTLLNVELVNDGRQAAAEFDLNELIQNIDKNGNLVSEGFHFKAGMPHAEAMAFNNLKKDAKGGSIYVNLEPCCHQG